MEIIKNKISNNIYIPSALKNILYSKKAIFFDIETTGFNKTKDNVVLIGILYQDKNCIVINQFFANSLDDEKELLIAFTKTISKFDVYITYNGDTFDIPFLNSKFKIHSLDFHLNKSLNLDLLKTVKKHKDILQLDNCKLKTVERMLGLNRKDEISGKESVKKYNEFLKTGDTYIKEIILQHNYDDIYYLPKILSIYDYIDEYNEIKTKLVFKDDLVEIIIDLKTLSLKGDILSISGSSSNISIHSQVYYDENFSFKWDTNKGNLNISIQLHHGYLSNGKKCFYIDKNDFNMDLAIIDRTDYSVPKDIIIIKENKKFIYLNIKAILPNFITAIFNELL